MPHPPSRFRILAWVAALLALPLLWKLGWAYGPALARNPDGSQPALFTFKAKAILMAELGFPRTLELTLPPPEPLSNAAAQLQLMGYWDGRGWTPKGTALGRVEGRSLKVDAGTLDLEAVERVGAATPEPDPEKTGVVRAEVSYRLRWTFNPRLQDLYQHRALVPLHPPRGLRLDAPGKTLTERVQLVRRGLSWTVETDPAGPRRPEVGTRNSRWAWLPWIF